MPIVAATEQDVPGAIDTLVDAFADYTMMIYMFQGDTVSRRPLVHEFMSILMQARLALGMPVLVLKHDGAVLGVVMGYNTERHQWPSDLQQRMAALEAHASVKERLAKCDAIVAKHQPAMPHYYLGVLGVHPALHGKGAGRQLIEAFSALSDNDPKSSGVYIDTTHVPNVAYYERRGFALVGADPLDENTTLSCLFKPKR